MPVRAPTRWCCRPAILGSIALLAGCQSAPDPEAWSTALTGIAEIQRIACPETDPADKAVLTRLTPRPKAWREKGATKGDLLAHIDRLELSEVEKALAAERVLAELDRCRGSGGEGPPTS